MNDELSQHELQEIATRAAAATVGPWQAFVEGRDHLGGDDFIRTGELDDTSPDMYVSMSTAEETRPATPADLDFIANARRDIPQMVSALLQTSRGRGAVTAMTPSRFLDRFDASTYEDDEPVRVFLVEGLGVDAEFLVPERLWHRLQAIASAYHLHLLPVLGWSSDPRFINAQQCETLVDELEFITTVVDDALLDVVVHKIVKLCMGALEASKNALGIDHP